MVTETGASGQPRSKPSDCAVRAQLDSILASAVFSRSPHLRRFLSFIVDQTLAGQGHTLKESVIAHELYGKGTDFDGGTDPVVRVDARRLRDKLREFYEGRSDPVVISLPKGRYVPCFRREIRNTLHSPVALIGRHEEASRSRISRARLVRRRSRARGSRATAVLAWRALFAPADAPAQLLPLASYPGPEGPPALSPDGELVAFAWPGHAGWPDGYLCEGRGE